MIEMILMLLSVGFLGFFGGDFGNMSVGSSSVEGEEGGRGEGRFGWGLRGGLGGVQEGFDGEGF